MAIKYPELFTPFKIGKVEIKNRIAMSPMHNIGWKTSDGFLEDVVLDYYEARARGGAGLIFTGSFNAPFTFPDGVRGTTPFNNPGMAIIQFKKLADRIHAYGSKLFIQLNSAAGGRNVFPGSYPPDKASIAETTCRWDPNIKLRALTREELKQLTDSCIQTAVISKKSGADGINLCYYGGYMMDELLMPFNTRTDEYGGDLIGKTKMHVDVIKGIKEACGKDFPVTVRMGTKQYMKGPRESVIEGEKYTEWGRDIEESIQIAKIFEAAGVDAFLIGNGTYDSFYWLYPPMYQKEGLWLDDVRPFTQAVSVPVICAGKILQPEMANEAIKDGTVTAVAMGRALLADPDWPNKAHSGQEEDIRPCIGCNIGCTGRIFENMPQACAVNAMLMREKEPFVMAPVSKKVAVIGGGVAGMECARVAALRGHKVTIYEKGSFLGGTFRAASVLKCKDAERRLLDWYELQLKKAGVTICLNTEITLADAEKLDCDEIVVATGNKAKVPPIPGVKDTKVYDPIKVLHGQQVIPDGSKVVIVGGGMVGCEVALWLKEEQGFENVSIIEGLPELLRSGIGGGEPVPIANRLMLIDLMKFHNVNVMTSTMLSSLAPGKVNVKSADGEKTIDADAVILSIGFNANNELYKEIYAHIPKKVWLLGDAQAPSNVMFGIKDADAVAKQI